MANSAREEILSRVRAALKGEKRGRGRSIEASPPEPVVDTSASHDDPRELAGLFVKELTSAKGVGRILENRTQVNEFASAIARSHRVESCAVSDSPLLREQLGIGEALESIGVRVFPFDAPRDELSRVDMGVTEAAYALAESGSLVSVHSPSEPRSLSLLPPVHLALVPWDRLLKDLYEAIERLYNAEYQGSYNKYLTSCFTFITGPSRTADIELNLTLGVHGPRFLYAGVLMIK